MLRSTFPILLALTFACSDSKKSDSAASMNQPAPETPAEPAAAPKPTAVAQSPVDEAKHTFATLCSTCHGADGKGDGPAAATLDPKPRNYTDKAWQASITDEQLAKVILEGGAAVGKSPLMPPNPQLKDKPEVIAELVKIVRSFGQ